MSFVSLKESNKTVMVLSLLALFLFGYLALSGLGIVPIGKLLGTPFGIGAVLAVGAIILILETFFEGNRPSIEEIIRFKEVWASMNVVLALLLGAAAILTLGSMAIPVWMAAILPYSYVVTFVLLAKELVFD
jgi:hypothetical protein